MDVVSFFSGVYVTVWKYYVVKGHDTIKVIYQITVKLDIGDKNVCKDISLNDVIEYTVKNGDVLDKIPEFEKEVEKREKELQEKAMKISEVLSKLGSMGYIPTEEQSVSKEQVIEYTWHCGY